MDQQPARESLPHTQSRCGAVDGRGPVPAGYADLRRRLAWGDLGVRSVVIVRGPDAVRFLDNFTTAALSPLAVTAGTEGFFADCAWLGARDRDHAPDRRRSLDRRGARDSRPLSAGIWNAITSVSDSNS